MKTTHLNSPANVSSDFGEALLIPKNNFKAVLAAEGKTGSILLYDKEKKRKATTENDPPKEGKSVIKQIRDETYQRLTAKPTLTGNLPIIYLPRVRQSSPMTKCTSVPALGEKESVPDVERRQLQLSLLSSGDEFGDISRLDTEIPVIVKQKVVKQRLLPKRRMKDGFLKRSLASFPTK